MFRKQDVRFPAEGGIELSAWLFVPDLHFDSYLGEFKTASRAAVD